MFLSLDGTGTLYQQLLRALKRSIADGRLAPGSQLPATRELAHDLGISRNTVIAAYELLRAERLAVGHGRTGIFVAPGGAGSAPGGLRLQPPRAPRGSPVHVEEPSRYAARLRNLPPLPMPRRAPGVEIDLQYGEPMTNVALFNAWSRSLSFAAGHVQGGYPRANGLLELRAQIASYLGRRRGVVCDADDVIVVNGTQQAFSLLARVLLDEGDVAVIEEPGYALAAHCLAAHGAQLLPVPVDGDGLVTALLPQPPKPPAKLIAVTPSHQFPLGVALTLDRRKALLQYANSQSAWIVEDDYDGEFGFEGRMLPALRSLDSADRVIYVGSFSKTVLPALRLGYIVCPRALRNDLVLARRLADIGSSGVDQCALAHFMASGAYERHLQRTALELRRRRHALATGLARHCAAQVVLQDSGAGMHAVAWLPGFDAARLRSLIARAEQQGLGLHGLAAHYASPPAMQGLLLGFANASVAQIRLATRRLGQCLAGP
ncbi:MAG TPA: PLP-dependent aminotransferase family protein [Rubrivivax sp.]|nr:PLP-dependent aminotransferase family protein [Rubrivivax sp.]